MFEERLFKFQKIYLQKLRGSLKNLSVLLYIFLRGGKYPPLGGHVNGNTAVLRNAIVIDEGFIGSDQLRREKYKMWKWKGKKMQKHDIEI